MDLYVSNSDPVLQMRSCAYYPKYGIGAFGIFPVIRKKRLCSEDFGLMGLRYGSRNLSVGITLKPFSSKDELPKSAWLVSKMGRLTTGVQFEPQYGNKDGGSFKNLMNWSCAIGYDVGSGSPLSPSFNFGLELAKNSQFIASFYQHVVVQRRNSVEIPSDPGHLLKPRHLKVSHILLAFPAIYYSLQRPCCTQAP
ncbi:hypothetical protein SDJN02_21294 [Cucurbita argyrosperma subsp. argyrosperma]|nr:hypothetical protein SDJN02_21294 [Cucurbita argyrosperma subsp. argyrosperma]